MKYLLLNRNNILVDILDEVRYIKLQSASGISIGCAETEGTGVVGSDCDTHYTLIKADIASSPDAVRVIEVETLPENIEVGLYKLDLETNELVYRYSLEEVKEQKQAKNKEIFADYLSKHPLTWIDGKVYGITEEDQNEISLNIARYQIEGTTLEWHAKKEESVPWTIEDLTALSQAISAQVYPIYHLMQQYKTQIYNATSIEEVNAIELVYN